MTATIVFNLIASIAVVAVLTAIFRLAYVVATTGPKTRPRRRRQPSRTSSSAAPLKTNRRTVRAGGHDNAGACGSRLLARCILAVA
jgi:hypothetical protein